MSASAVDLFWVGESQPQRFDTRMLAAKGFGAAVVHDGGRLTSDANWSANVVHIVYGTIVVETNVTLTIQAGAVVQFAGGGIYVRGDCIANGVHFADAASDEVVSYVLKGNVVTDGATTFRGLNYQDDFQRHGDSSSFAFDTRGLMGKALSGTAVHWGGRLNENETWAAGQTHLVYGSVTVPTNVTLTVERGAVVKFAGGGIRADGSLVAEGVQFADLDDDSVGGDTRKDGWTQPHVSYAIDGDVYDDANTIYRCLDTHGEWLLDGASAASAFNTRGYGAADLAGAVTHEGAVTSDETWSASETHVVYGTLYVAAGVTLTIEPGAVVKFVGGGLAVDGRCVARGVTFTDLDDDSHGATRANAKLPEASYVLEGEIETDDATVMMCSKGNQNDLADPGVSRVFRLETDLERVRFAGVPREVTFNTAWDESTAVEVTETRPDGSTVVLTNGTADCAGVFLWDAGETPGLYTLRHVTDTNELSASFYRLFNAQVHSGPISETNVWEAGVVHVIDRSVSVKAGGSLLIEPGAVVKFFPGSGLTIEAGGICTARDVIFTSVHDISVGGDTLGEGGATEPSEEEYLIVGYIRDSATTEYRYGTHSLSGTIAGVETWEANRVYVIDGTLTVAAGGSLAIARGAIVKFTSGSTLAVENGATCSAEGVIFTHIADDTAGGDTMGDGDETQPEIGAYTITGLILDDETTQYRYGAPVVTSGTILKSTFWRSRNVYRVTGNLTIANGATLTIMPGAIVKFDDGKSMTVASGGTLNAIGTRAQPIVFTSVKDDEHGWDANGDGSATRADCGDWKEIVVSGAFNANYVNVLYGAGGGASDLVDAIKICSGGTVSMKNSRIEHMQRYAVCDEGGSSHFENCVINDVYMAFRHGSGYRDVFDNCVIHDCSYLSNNGGQVFRNCIVTDMTTDWQWGTQYGLVQCLNCIFWNKDGNFGPHSLPRMQSGSVGNIWSDPMFVDSDNGDFRIVEGSPCIDAGDGTVAPELDWYGQPRVTFPSAQQTGKPDAKGRFVDIGIYEVQPRNVKSDIDLSIVSVAAESSVTVGATLKVSWTVENLGSVNATGSWRDMFELIDSSGATVKLGSYTVSGSIVAGGQRVFTTSFRVPAAAVGEARLRVKVNPERDIFEGTATGNNVAIADGTIDIAVAAYSASEHSVVSIDAGSSTALTIPADSGITALIIKGGAGLSAFGAYGYVPKALRNDITAVRLEDGSLLLTLPSTDSAGDFTFVIANGGYGAENVSVEPVTESLEVTEVTPNRLANTGDGYLTLRGIALDRVAQLRLVGGATFAPTAFSAASSGELSATFPLADATPGTYALEVEDADGETHRLDAAVEIYKPKMGPKLEAHLEIPTAVRQGRIYTGKIVYSNVGDTDMYAPYFRVKAVNAELKIGIDDWESRLDLVGISSRYPAGVLNPNDRYELEFSFRAGNQPRIELECEDDKSDLWQALSAEISETVTRLNDRGREICKMSVVRDFLERENEGENVAAMCGTLLDVSSGDPLSGVEIEAVDGNQRVVSRDVVDEYGVFVLEGVGNATNYQIRVTGAFVEKTDVVMPLSGDLIGLNLVGSMGYEIEVKIEGLNGESRGKLGVIVTSLADGGEYVCGSDAGIIRVPGEGLYLVHGQDGTGLEMDAFVCVELGVSKTPVTLDFSLGCVVFGTVYDASGAVVSNALLTLSKANGRGSQVATSGADGCYRFGGLMAGSYLLSVESEGYSSVIVSEVELADGSEVNRDISLTPLKGALFGRVLDGTVDMTATFSIHGDSRFYSTQVKDDSSFSFDVLPEGVGDLMILGKSSEIVQKIPDVMIAGQTFLPYEVSLPEKETVVVVMKDENGSLVDGDVIFGSSDALSQMEETKEGVAAFLVRPDVYRIYADSPDRLPFEGYLRITSPTQVVVTLVQGGFVKVVLPSEMRENASVNFVGTDGQVEGGVDGEGMCVSEAMPNGKAFAFVTYSKGACYSSPVVVEKGVTNSIDGLLPTRRLSIALSDESSDRASVLKIIHKDGTGLATSHSWSRDRVELVSYPRIPLEIVVYDGQNTRIGSVEVAADVEAVTVPLLSVEKVSGRIEGTDGAWYVGGTVSFMGKTGVVLASVVLDSMGAFCAWSVPEEWTGMWVELPDGTMFAVEREAAEKSAFVIKVPEELISTEILTKDGNGISVPYEAVEIRDEQGNKALVRSDAQGRVSLKISKGKYTVKTEHDVSVRKIVDNGDGYEVVRSSDEIVDIYDVDSPADGSDDGLMKIEKRVATNCPEAIPHEEHYDVVLPHDTTSSGNPWNNLLDILSHPFSFWTDYSGAWTELEYYASIYYQKLRPRYPVPECTHNWRIYNEYLTAKNAYESAYSAAHNALMFIDQEEREHRLSIGREILSWASSFSPQKWIQIAGTVYQVATTMAFDSTTGEIVATTTTTAYNIGAERISNACYDRAFANNLGNIYERKRVIEELSEYHSSPLATYYEEGLVEIRQNGNAIMKNRKTAGKWIKGGGMVISTVTSSISIGSHLRDHLTLIDEYNRYYRPNLANDLVWYRAAAERPYHNPCTGEYEPRLRLIRGTNDVEITTLQSCDPNEMAGPMGVGDPETERFVKPGEWMTYTVYFENKSDAAAAAQEVTVSNPLSEWLDWSTFEMGEVAFNNQIDLGLVGKKNGTSEVTMNGTNYAVRTELKLNEQAGVADWYMRIVDSTTETGWPEDVFAGFLPPNDETFCGEGHITYRIKVREDAPKGARIDNSATIVFDYNDPIETDPAWWNTVGSAGGEAAFAANELTVDEGGTLKVAVCGGHELLASSVQVQVTYNTATAADLDLKGARVDGVKPKSFKFPVALEWAAGEIGEREIEIPVVVDKAVEADEFLTLQLANPMNLEIGDVSICTVTIHDPQYDALKAKVAAGTVTKAEVDALAKADKVFAGKAYVRGLANDATRGKVTGSALAAAGKGVTLKASANKGWVFAGWYTDPACTAGRELTGYGDYRNPSLSYPNTNGAVTVYARFIAPEEDSLSLGEDFLQAELAVGHNRYVPVPVESVSYPTVTFSGLPSGVRYDAALGGLTGAPKKTAKPTTVTVTVKNLGGYRIVRKYELSVVAFEAMNPSEPPAKRLSDAAPFHSVALTRNDDFAGKVTGAGVYQTGKKVTLKATANKGFVFSGWYEGGVDGGRGAAALPAGEPVSQLASYAFAMPSNDLAYVARFVTVDEDGASVGATVNGSAFGAACVGEAVTKLATNVMAGVYLEWPVAASALSQPTVKVSGLPSGLKFTAKPVTAKVGSGKAAVTVTNVPPNTIYGAPTAASKTAKDKATGLMAVMPSKVKVTVTTAGKSKAEYAIDLTVNPLPAWAVGEFSGHASTPEGRRGSASMSVTAAGKVSGKVVVNGTNCSFSATSYDAASRTVGATNLVTVVTGKLGKVPVTGEIAVVESGAQGAVAGATMELSRNVWKDKGADPVPAEAQGLYTVKLRPDEFSFPGIGTGHLSLTVDKKGAVKVAGKAADGTSLSASATLMPGAEAGRHFVDLFAAPSAYKGGYVAGRLDLDASGAVSSPYCLDWTSFNPQSTGDYALGGFSRVLAAPGAWYSKTDSLTNHYHTLNFAAPDATERVPPASAQAHWGDLTVSVDASGKKFAVDQKATKPVQDKGSRAWSYDGANDAALTFSFTQATGIWKGSFLWWFDGAKHTSQKVPFEGVLVQGEDLEGFGTVDASSTYVPYDKNGNPQKAKSYKYRESVPVSFRAE